MNVEVYPPVIKFIKSINDKSIKKKILSRFKHIEDYGIQKLFKANEAERFNNHKIDEIKIRGKIQYRFFGASIEGVYWILHGFIKKTQEVRDKETKTALKRKRDIKSLYANKD